MVYIDLMSGPHGIGPKVQELLRAGRSNRSIRRELGVGSATVSYHAKKIGISTARRPTYSWIEIQLAIDGGADFSAIQSRFGCANTSFYRAVREGKISRPVPRSRSMTPEVLAEKLMGKEGRGPRWRMKKKLLKSGRLEYRCGECGLDEWRGQILPLRLDHIDGNGKNFVIANLRLLCGNCDSLQETFCHRNVGRTNKSVRI